MSLNPYQLNIGEKHMMLDITKIPNLNIKIPHRNWQEALDHSFSLLIASQPGDVVCIVGPSRAGKTRLISELEKMLTHGNDFEVTGELPVVVAEVMNNSTYGAFSTKDFALVMLEATKHPIYTPDNSSLTDEVFDQKISRTPERTLNSALYRILKFRKTMYLFIDEAQHAKYAPGVKGAHAIMDSWKGLAQKCKLVLVIVAAYPIFDVIKKSAHMIGRKHQVHLARYQYTKEDLKEFVFILDHYDKVIDVDESLILLRNCAEYLYEGTFGCIGLLRGWLTRATAYAGVKGTGVTLDILKKTAWPDNDRKVIAKEINAGEKYLKAEYTIGEYNSLEKSSKKYKPKKGKPFKKNPKRYSKNNRTEVPNEE